MVAPITSPMRTVGTGSALGSSALRSQGSAEEVLRFSANKCTGCCYVLEEYLLLTKGTTEVSYKFFQFTVCLM